MGGSTKSNTTLGLYTDDKIIKPKLNRKQSLKFYKPINSAELG